MPETVVDQLYAEYSAVLDAIPVHEVSLRNTANECFRKSLLLAAASHFEKIVQIAVVRCVTAWGANCNPLDELVRQKAIERQYHTYFDWKANNANKFLRLFGDGFRKHTNDLCKTQDGMDGAIRAFMEIGRERNRLAHQDFGSYTLEKTMPEIYEAYKSATKFAHEVETLLLTYAPPAITAPPPAAETPPPQ